MRLPEQEYVAIDSIRPYPNNPRRISEAAVEAVKKSIETCGMVQPLVVDHAGVIVVGHTRYAALGKLGHVHVPVYRLAEDTPPEKIAEYRLVDNRTGEMARWDNDALVIELREIERGVIEEFFPHVDLRVETIRVDDVTAQDIEEAVREVSTVADPPGKGEPMITLECPSCSYAFEVTERSFMGYVDY